MLQRLALLIVLILPCLAGSWIIGRIADESRLRETAARRDELERMIGHGARLSQVPSWVEERAGRIRRSVVWGENPAPLLVNDGRKVFRAYLFSRDGKRLLRPGCEADMVRTSERCLELIAGMAAGTRGRLNPSERKLVESFFGVPLAADFLARNPGKMIGAEEFHQNRMAGVFSLRTRTRPAESVILLLVVDTSSLAVERLAAAAAAKLRRKAGSGYRFGVIDTIGRLPDRPRPWPAAWRRLLCRERLSGSFTHANRQFSTRPLDRRFILFGCRRLPASGPYLPFMGLFLFAGAATFAFVTLSHAPPLPIRRLVIILFGLAGIAGGTLLLGFSAVYRDARQSAVIQERSGRAKDLLANIDAGLGEYLERLSDRFRRVTKALGPTWNDSGRTTGILGSLRPLEPLASVILFDRDGRVLTRFGTNITMKRLFQGDEEGEMAVVVRQAVRILEHRSSGRGFGEPPPENTASYMGWQYAKMFANGIGTLFHVEFSISAFTFFDVVLAPDGSIRGFLLVLFEQGKIERSYLSRMRRNLRESAETIGFPAKLIALPKTGRELRVERIGEAASGDLLDLHMLVSQTGSPESRGGAWKGRSMLMVGVPGSLIAYHNLLLLTPMRPIEESSASLRRAFLALAAVLLLYGLGLGWQFTSMVLAPVRELARGMENLAASRFSSAVSLPTADEFEEIGNGLNETFDEMKEMSFARAIQENLFPGGPLEAGTWSCRGWTVSSSDIGGEIYDHHLVDDGAGGSLGVLWIARVPGHSVGSALVLAMTKMALRLLASGPRPDAQAVLDGLAGRFPEQADLLGRASLFIGIYAPTTGRLDWACRGAFAVMGGRETGSGTPFAGRRSVPPGSRVLVCSEGCWQNLPGGGDQLNYELRLRPAQTTSDSTYYIYNDFISGGTGSRTILMLERHAEGQA